VADFEMNTRHRHETPPNEEQSSLSGRTL